MKDIFFNLFAFQLVSSEWFPLSKGKDKKTKFVILLSIFLCLFVG